MKVLTKIIDGINRVIGGFIAILLAIMSVVIIFQVITRFTPGSLPWSEELARFVMIYITFLGTAYACRYDQLMSVKFIQAGLPEKVGKIIYIFALLIQIAFFTTVFAEELTLLSAVKTQLSSAMRIPMFVPYSAMMIGSFLSIFNCLYLLVFRALNIPVDFSMTSQKKEVSE